MDQDVNWHGGRPRPRSHCVRWGPETSKRHSSPQFSVHVYCGQRAGLNRIPLGTEVGLGPGDIVLFIIFKHQRQRAYATYMPVKSITMHFINVRQWNKIKQWYNREILECGPMPNVMAALPNGGGALCSTPQSLADAHYWRWTTILLQDAKPVEINWGASNYWTDLSR